MSATKFIRLTLSGGKPLYINAAMILSFSSCAGPKGDVSTVIDIQSGNTYTFVRETCDEICARLGIAP